MSQIKEFIQTKQAAKEIGMALRTIQVMVRDGRIPARKFGRVYMIERKQWEEWKARNITAA